MMMQQGRRTALTPDRWRRVWPLLAAFLLLAPGCIAPPSPGPSPTIGGPAEPQARAPADVASPVAAVAASPSPPLVATAFDLTPSGSEIDRLTPIRVSFPLPPTDRDAAQLLQLDPPAQGSYAWIGDRTVQFQPSLPGLARGRQYTIRVAAQPAAGLANPTMQVFTTGGQLKIESVIPAPDDREVPRNAQILVQFNRSVAPLTLLGVQAGSPLAIDPPVPGRGEWLNTSLYRFVPDELEPSTQYRLRLPANLAGAVDASLTGDFDWRFSTVSPALATVSPGTNATFVGPRQSVVLKFNQPMDRLSVTSGVRLEGSEGLPVTGVFSWSERDTVASFSPLVPLPLATTFELVVPAGLKGASGGVTLAERRSSFTTVGEPKIDSTDPAPDATTTDRYSIDVKFSNPMDRDSVDDKVAVSGFEPSKIRLSWGGDRNLSIRVADESLKPSASYSVTLTDGIVDRYGLPLAPYSFSFKTAALRSSVSFAVPSEIAIYSASAEPRLYFHALNQPTVRFTLHPLTPDEMHTIQRRDFISSDRVKFSPSLPALRTWTESPAAEPNEDVLASTLLSRGGPLPLGDYYLTADANLSSFMVFSVVNTELATKLNTEELLVWALDHDSGRPVPNARVQADGPMLSYPETRTDAQGLATFRLSGQVEPNQRKAYLVTLDQDGRRGVTSTYWQGGVEAWRLGMPLDYYPSTFNGHLYTDRPLYQRGERVEYKGVLRLDDDAANRLPETRPGLDFVVRDPQGKVLRREPIQLNEFGSFAGTFVLPPEAETGDYELSVRATEGNEYSPGELVTSAWFLVAAFRKPEFQVAVTAEKPDYVTGEQIGATAEATYFFGGPAASAPVEWSSIAQPFRPSFTGFERYTFLDLDAYRPAVVSEYLRAEGKATTDDQGRVRIAAPANLTGNEGPKRFQIGATVTDQSAQEVGESTSVIVHPAALYVGLRPARYLATVGEEATIDLATVDVTGQPMAGQAVALRVYQREWITTKEQRADGGRRYISEPRDTLITTLNATTDGQGLASARYTPATGGNLRLVAEVTDSGGRFARASTTLWVSGGAAEWEVNNSDVIQLVADKERYEVGDVAQVMVPAPFQDSYGLVTIERGKIISGTTRAFQTNAERLSIPIVDSYVPNVYVSIVLYKPPTESDPVPRYKVGYVELPVSTGSRVLNVAIRPDRPQTQPGEKVRYELDVTDSAGRGVRAELSVAVVDKALLSLTDERGPNGLKAFWYEHGLGIQTAASLAVSVDRANDAIAEAVGKGGKGGGGVDSDRLRQDFRNTAFWAGQLVTDQQGHASVEVAMPDNLTTWRLQARAVSGTTMVGEGTSELVSTRPLLLRPALPRLLRVGDSASLRLLARNATSAPLDLQVGLTASGIEVSGEMSRALSVAPGESALLEWSARATAAGSAHLAFSGTASGGQQDAVALDLPIQAALTSETVATGGVVLGEPRAEAVYLPDYTVQQDGAVSVTVQGSLVGLLGEEVALLKPCCGESAERVASRLIASLGQRRAEGSVGRPADPAAEQQIQRDLASLVATQRSDGGWGWCSSCETDASVTGWAAVALGQARRSGRAVDSGVLNEAAKMISNFLNRPVDVAAASQADQRAFLLYALASTSAGEARGQALALQEQERTQLRAWGRANLVLALLQSDVPVSDSHLAQTLLDLSSSAQPSATGNHWEDPPAREYSFSNVRATALVLEALARAAPDHPLLDETVRWLTVARSAQRWQSSTERAQAVLALSEYLALTGEARGPANYQVRLGDRELLSGQLDPGSAAPVQKTLPLSVLPLGQPSLLTFLREFGQPGRLYYGLNLRYATPAAQVEALNRGVAISHRYSALADAKQPIDRVRLGETVRVTVTVLAPTDLNYVEVEDLLPAGLEPVDPKLKIVDQKLKAQLEADRRKALEERRPGYQAPWYSWYYNPWRQAEPGDDRVTLRTDRLAKGVYDYVYYARATTPGDFALPPARAEQSYFPDVFGRSDSGRFVVLP